MRGLLLLVILGTIIAAGCIGPEPVQPPINGTNTTNDSNITPPEPVCTGPVCGSDGVTYETDCIAEYGGVSILHDGVCEENCTDSDGGIQPDVAGTVAKGKETFYDYCLDVGQLAEYVCADNVPEMATINCGENKECFRDRCVDKQIPPEPDVVPECVGPAEADIMVNESVSYNRTIYRDSCVEFQVVKDYFCKDNALQAINHECPPGYGCTFGRCEKQYMRCTDSDGGNDTAKRGRTQVVKGISTVSDDWDECIDAVTIREYYCREDNASTSQEIDCGSGFKCFEDRCLKSKCSETDGGLNIFRKGTTTAGGEEFTDECVDAEEIWEYYCYGDEIRMKADRCGRGYICNPDSHKCVEGEEE